MAEETGDDNRKTCQYKQNIRCPENGWIVCRSKKRPGLYYDFNTSTGEALWRDADNVDLPTAVLEHGEKYDCHEPIEPPSQSAYCQQQNDTQSSMTPNIHNKQVINNQFPAKPFPIPPFGNAPCAQFGLNNMALNGTTTPFLVFPSPQVSFLGQAMAPLNPVQALFESLQNMQLQNPTWSLNNNTTVPLSNRFQILNQLNNERQPTEQLGIKKTCHTTPKKKTNFVRERLPNPPNDLRSLLSDRRRLDLQNNSEVSDWPKTPNSLPRDKPATVTKPEITPDDTDEWLETHTDDEGKKLNIDMECIWEVVDSSASQQCWYLVTTSKVLLSNIRFCSALAASDERLRLLAPQDVVRGLRSATFSDKRRLAECAKRLLLAIRQNKLPNIPNDASIMKFSSELIGQNKPVILLTDETDIHGQNNNTAAKFSVSEFKQFLGRYTNRKITETNTVSNMQKICAKVKIIVPNTDVKPEILSSANTTRSTSISEPEPQEVPSISLENILKENETSLDDAKIQTNICASSEKRTANACVQTDLNILESQAVQIRPDQDMKINPAVGTSEYPNDGSTSKVVPRKIKLKRQLPFSNVASDSDVRKTFKWRKRKDACSTPNLTPSVENSHKSFSHASSLSNSTNDLMTPQNDNAVDGVFSDGSLNAKLIEETSTSGVVSNSLDSESMFKINKQAILNESQTNQNEEIFMYEVTSDFMNDRLKTRCDEWAPRFIQIMEEALTVVLLLEPVFVDESPWSLAEATNCIRRKFKGYTNIFDASDKLAAFLFEISDERGNINSVNSKEFMKMFSYGVNLINKLQLELPNCEDLKIASESLFKLLSDIDGTEDTFIDEDPLDNSVNISGTMTSLSTDVPDRTEPKDKESPRIEEKQTSSDHSPARCSLRSRRLIIQKKKEEENIVTPCSSNNEEYSLFSSLGLQKNKFTIDTSITKTITNVSEEQQSRPLIAEQTECLTPDTIQDTSEVKSVVQKIFRNFTICPEIEMKLKSGNNSDADVVDQTYSKDDHVAAYDGAKENIDFTEDDILNSQNFVENNNYCLMQTAMDVESTKSGDLDSNGIFKWFVQRTTYDYTSCLVKLRRFCEITHEDLKTEHFWDPEYKSRVMERITKVSARAIHICDRMKSILNREPSVMKSKFRDLFMVFGVHEDISDTQLSEYRNIIEKYCEHADRLLTFVKLLIDLVKEK